ncbi:hypothetical protein [Hydrogenophaga sp.]|uniref:hypothetical protein n=1 Tax=Hydrogenophaga sp. TaxID=1904254 RepID=UPI0027320FE4|nr:hypothetical protein [Hydrogenophaga sp.]MDP2073392.1 hypothetical protein [Hydrogenophaga sp.]MDP3106780.1 hypothetical protein [Hydrogenophaga sp.]
MSKTSAKTEAATPNLTQASYLTDAGAAGASLDLTALRLPQNFGAVAGVKKVITTVPVRKPGNQTFVRVHPAAEWQLSALILQLKEDGECYFVHPSLAPELAQEVRAKQLYTYVGRDGNVALWPVNLPGEDGRLDQWSQSAHTAAQMAQASWIRMVANRPVGAYDVYEAPNLSDEPTWPELSFKEVLNLAFKDRLITALDHPIVKRLRGEM